MSRNLRYAIKQSIPIMIGFFPVGIAYGILMSSIGYNFLWSGFTSLFVFAGSLQFLMVSFFAGSVPVFTIIVMTLLLNSRHIFYGLSFIDKFKQYGPLKWLMIYSLTDEVYSLYCAHKPAEGIDEKRIFPLYALCVWTYWIVFSTLGGLVGQLLPFDTTGIDFALTALFVCILIDQLRSAGSRLPAGIAILSSLVCIIIFGAEHFILPSLLVTVIVLLLLRKNLEKTLEATETEVQ